MSRTRKKCAVIKDNNWTKRNKKVANKKLRRKYHYNIDNDDTINGGDYRKFYEHWLISDWKFKLTEKEAIDLWFQEELEELYTGNPGSLHKGFKTLKAYLKWWKTTYLYK